MNYKSMEQRRWQHQQAASSYQHDEPESRSTCRLHIRRIQKSSKSANTKLKALQANPEQS